MEVIDMEGRLEKAMDRVESGLSGQLTSVETDLNRRIDDEQTMAKASLNRLERNLDKRFDNVWTDIHKLDSDVNPNKELLKG